MTASVLSRGERREAPNSRQRTTSLSQDGLKRGGSLALRRLAMFDIATGAIVVASDNGKLPVNQYLPAVVAKLTDANGNWKFPLLSRIAPPAERPIQTEASLGSQATEATPSWSAASGRSMRLMLPHEGRRHAALRRAAR